MLGRRVAATLVLLLIMSGCGQDTLRKRGIEVHGGKVEKVFRF